MADEKAYGRRQFFRDSVTSVARAAYEYHRQTESSSSEKPVAAVVRHDFLRPPGAVDESLFLGRCTRCQDCVKACPYGAISLSKTDGSPVIFADQVPCYLCHDLPCASSCETGALVVPEGLDSVRMGTAVVSDRYCTASQGCHACVSKCPMEALSMEFSDMQLRVDDQRCVGCGVCEHVCGSVNDRVAIRVRRDG